MVESAKFMRSTEPGVFFVKGPINEHTAFDDLPEIKGLKLELSGVTSINSLGVRGFIQFVLKMAGKGLELHRCSLVVVDMINTYPMALGDPVNPAMVKSMYIPYTCQPCRRDESVLIALTPSVDGVAQLPAKTCGRCGSAMGVEDARSDYFVFMTAESA